MTCIVVLGLHCGGTSAVAGVLHHLGVFMGEDLLGTGYNNPKGHFEDREFVELNDWLVGNWKKPDGVLRHRLHPGYGDLIGRRVATHSLWGVKDPRMMWVYPQFLYHINQTDALPLTLFVYRKPSVAAQSLYFRGGHSPAEALEISYRYYLQMDGLMRDIRWEKCYGIKATEGYAAPWYESKDGSAAIVSYENLVKDPHETVKGIMSWIGHVGGEWPFDEYAKDRAVDFIDPSLCHWKEA